jgi:hypothetical protein
MRYWRAAMRDLVTLPLTWWLLLGPILLTLLSVLANSVGTKGQAIGVSMVGTAVGQLQLLQAVAVGGTFAIFLGVLFATSAHRHRLASAYALVVPRRYHMTLARAAAVSLGGAGYALVSTLITLAGAAVLLVSHHDPLLLSGLQVAGVCFGALAIGALSALLGFVAGEVIRSQVAALVIVMVWVTLVQGALMVYANGIGRFLPIGGENALLQTPGAGFTPLAGLALLVGYAVAGMALLACLRRRDLA